MKPRTTVVVSFGLFALATFVAIIVVLAGGGDGKRKHRRIADLSMFDVAGYGGAVRAFDGGDLVITPGPTDVTVARRRKIMVTVEASRIEVLPIDFPVSHSVKIVDRFNRMPELVWDDLGGVMQALQSEDGEAEVQIVAGSDIPHGDVVQVMDAAKAAGFSHLELLTH